MKLTLSGGISSAVPGLRLPGGTFQLALTRDNGLPAPIGQRLWLHAMEGGGGFGPAGSPLQSQVEAPPTTAGGASPVPELVLGLQAEANRFIAQGTNAHVGFTIRGSWDSALLSDTTPVHSGLCHEVLQVTVELRDAQFPASIANPAYATVEGVRLAAEVTDFGGWIVADGPLLRAAIFHTDLSSKISFNFRLSSRAETSTVRVYLLDAPYALNTHLDIQFTARSPRLLSSGSAGRNESIDKMADGWLSKLVRVGTADLQHDQLLAGPLVDSVEIGLRDLTAGAVIYPSPRAGWGGVSSLVARPHAGSTTLHWGHWLPDFPDDSPMRTIDGQSQDRLSGPTVGSTALPAYIQQYNGGVRDDAHGVELQNPLNDMQHLGPKAKTFRPFQFNLATKLLAGAPDRSLLTVKLQFKVRMTPSNSLVDDPNATPEDVPGTISLTAAGPFADQQLLEIQVANPYPLPLPALPPSSTQGANPAWILPGTTGRINLYFQSSDQARDCDVEVTATVTIEQKIRDPQTGQVTSAPQTTEQTTLLARAFFPRPRVSFTKLSAGNYLPIDDEAIVPAPLIDVAGNVMAHDKAREFYLEYRTDDPNPISKILLKSTIGARLYGGSRIHDLTLTKVSSNSECALFRSPPIVCYLERPEPDGLTGFTQLDNQPFQAVQVEWAEQSADRPYGLSASVTPSVNNPQKKTFWTPIRPLTFLNVEAAGGTSLEPAVPLPQITLDGFNASSNNFPVTLDKSVTPPLAVLTVSGTIRDVVGDLTPQLSDRISQVTINTAVFTAQTGDVLHVAEAPSKLRPHAAYEKFTGKVSLYPGFNLVQISAVNVLGGKTTRVLQVEILDSRNAFDDEKTMSARVTVTASPIVATSTTPLAMAHYRTPHLPPGTGLSNTFPVSVQSLGSYPSASVTDQISVTITRDARAAENVYASDAFLLVPDDVDPQAYTAAKQVGIQLIKHIAGSRLMVSGTLRTPVGNLPLQNLTASSAVRIRMLVQRAGAWVEQSRLKVGDLFTFEADYPQPNNPGTVELLISSCDRLGRVLPQPGRRQTLVMSYDAAQAKWTMTGYEDMTKGGILVNATHLVAVSRHGDAPGQGILRVLGGGTISAQDSMFWSVDHGPARQPLAGVLAAQESIRGTSARTGARQTVIARTGELVLDEHDVSLKGRGIDLGFTRSYRSFLDYDGPMGYGWSHSLERWLHRLDPNTYLWVGAGRLTTFSAQSATTFYPDEPGVYAVLEIEPNNIVRVRWAGGSQEVFAPRSDVDPAYLPLLAQYDRCRNKVGLVYNQSGTLIRAEDPLNQPLYLHHNDLQCVDIVGDGTERIWNYSYWDGTLHGGSNGDLKFADAPPTTWRLDPHAAARRSYNYDPVAPHKLNQLQDPRGNDLGLPPLMTMTFDGAGRVHTQQFGDGTYTFNFAPTETLVTDRNGNKRTFAFKPGAVGVLDTLPAAMTAFDTNGTAYTTVFTYNGQGEIKSIAPPPGSMTPVSQFDFDDTASDPRNRGNMTRRRLLAIPGLQSQYLNLYQTVALDVNTDPTPTQLAKLEWVYDYGPASLFQQPLSVTDPHNRVVTYHYDFQASSPTRSDGNLVQTDEPPVATNVLGGTLQRYSTRWIYNNFGETLWRIAPSGVVTQFQYFPADTPNGGLGITLVFDSDKPSGHLAATLEDTTAKPPIAQPIMRSASLTSAEERRVDLTYDSHGFPASVIDAARNRTSFQYDELGVLKQHIGADGATVDYAHDANGQLIKQTSNIVDLHFPTGIVLPPPAALPPTSTITQLDYDRAGNRISIILDQGRLNLVTRYEYDKNENLLYLRTPVANALTATPADKARYTKYEYDGLDRLIHVTKAPDILPAWRTDYAYYPDGKLKIKTDANGCTTTHFYNCFGFVVEDVDQDGNSRRTWRDALGHVTVLEHYGTLDGSASHSGTLKKSFVYLDELDREIAHADQVFRWDALLNRQNIGRRITQWIHDPAGNIVETINARQYHTAAQFNGHGQQRAVRSVLTGDTSYGYDSNGNLNFVTLPSYSGLLPIQLLRKYDAANRIILEQKLGGGTVQYFYDTLGRLRVTQDQLGNRVFHEYDAVGRRTRMLREMRDYGTSPNPVIDMVVTTYTFDLNGNLLQVIDANKSVAIDYTYESHEQVQAATYPDDGFSQLGRPGSPRTTTFLYYPNGLVRSSTTPDGLVVSHEYTNAGLLSKRKVSSVFGLPVSGTTLQTFVYDGSGRCISASDNNGDPTKSAGAQMLFDSLDNIWEDIQTESFSGSGARTDWPRATYNAAGELDQVTYPGWPVPIQYSFDPAGRPMIGGQFASYGYKGAYLANRSNSLNRIQLSVSHNAQGLIQDHLIKDLSTGKILGGNQYKQWNAAALPVISQDAVSGLDEEFVYDSVYRVVTNTHFDNTYQPTSISTLKYDRTGNPTLLQTGSTTNSVESRWSERIVNQPNEIGQTIEHVDPNASFNWTKIAAGALLVADSLAIGPAGLAAGGALLYAGYTAKSNPGLFAYLYDARGNIVQTQHNGQPQREYTFDVFNRLIAATDKTTGKTSRFYYDAFGRRLAKDSTAFSYLGKHMLQEQPGAGGWHKNFFYASDDLVGFSTDQHGSLEQYCVHDDRGGTILALSDSAGDIRESYTYDLFGKPTIRDFLGRPVALDAGKGNFFLHQGQYYDIETGLYCVGSRYYDPLLQRFLQADKISWDIDTNRYSFAANNNQCLADPTGNMAFLLPVGLALIGAAAVGFIAGVALSAAQQTLLYIDTKGESGFSLQSMLAAGAMGAVCGAALELCPELALPMGLGFAALGAGGAVQNFHAGNFRAGTLDAVMALLPFWHAVRSPFRDPAKSTIEVQLISRKRLNMGDGSNRSSTPLTSRKITKITAYLRQYSEIGTTFADRQRTSVRPYDLGPDEAPFLRLIIGADVNAGELPAGLDRKAFSTANRQISWRGAIAHELAGHAAAIRAGKMQAVDWVEETQASFRAAMHGPELSFEQRMLLVRDALNRPRLADETLLNYLRTQRNAGKPVHFWWDDKY